MARLAGGGQGAWQGKTFTRARFLPRGTGRVCRFAQGWKEKAGAREAHGHGLRAGYYQLHALGVIQAT